MNFTVIELKDVLTIVNEIIDLVVYKTSEVGYGSVVGRKVYKGNRQACICL